MPVGDKLKFISFRRSKLFQHVTLGADGRLRGTLELTLKSSQGQSQTGKAPFALWSAAEVTGLNPGAILHVAPAPFVKDAETTKLVHIDFVEADLPWRYTPKANSAQLDPWLVLLVGTSDELEVRGNLVTRSEKAVLDAHPLDKSYLWAHVQDDGARMISRLVSPRKLEAQHEYTAVLVPAFNTQSKPMWNNGVLDPNIVLPALYSWRFWTAEAGDFETLAAALRKRKVEELGIAPVHFVRHVTNVDVTMIARGAITNLQTAPDPTTGVEEAGQDLEALNLAIVDEGKPKREIIGLPMYGRPWLPDPDIATWGRTLNDDPRFRGIAGLGVWLGILAQEQLMDAAVKQAGALREVSQLVRQLALGLTTARNLWTRRLPSDGNQRLRVFGPAMGRLLSTQGGSVLKQITSGTSPIPSAFFSSAAQRFLRDGTARARHSAAEKIDRAALLKQINFGPVPIFVETKGVPQVNEIARNLGQRNLEDLLGLEPIRDELWEVVRRFDGLPNDDENRRELFLELRGMGMPCSEFILQVLRNLDSEMPRFVKERLMAIIRFHCSPGAANIPFEGPDPTLTVETVPPIAPPRFRPIHLDTLVGIIVDTINPHQARPPVWKRIQARVPDFQIETLAPPELPLGLDFPTWQLVNQYAKEWMLPGRGRVPKDTIVALETNPAFVDAFMVGINTQFMSEMRWRGLPIPRTFTPLRMFWGYVHYEQGNVRREADIQPFSEWVKHPETDIGDLTHQTIKPGDTTGKRDLVIAFKSDLFRRYPSTLVYLVKKSGRPEPADTDRLKATPEFELPAAGRENRVFLGPIFFCDLEPDLRCFMFDLTPTELDEYWLVLDEPPSELRFRHPSNAEPPLAVDALGFPSAAATMDSASFAQATIDKPTRVAIDGKWLEEQPEQ